MDGLPVTIRLLDPPLHEFLPQERESSIRELAESRWARTSEASAAPRRRELHEFNPMLGHRGCRLGITYPEIYPRCRSGRSSRPPPTCAAGRIPSLPEIMIPLIGHVGGVRPTRSESSGGSPRR